MIPVLPLALVGLLILALSRRKPSPGGSGAPDGSGAVAPTGTALDTQLRKALDRVTGSFGLDVARNVERIYRLETDNFKSEQFARTNTPGMHAFGASFPFGWSLADAGFSASDFLPTIMMDENAGGTFQWVVFKELPDAVYFLGYFLNKYGNNPGRWKSTDPLIQAPYNRAVEKFDTPIVDSLTVGI